MQHCRSADRKKESHEGLQTCLKGFQNVGRWIGKDQKDFNQIWSKI